MKCSSNPTSYIFLTVLLLLWFNPVFAVEREPLEQTAGSVPPGQNTDQAVQQPARSGYRIMLELASKDDKGSVVLGADAETTERGIRFFARIVKFEWGTNRIGSTALKRLPELEFEMERTGKFLTCSDISLEIPAAEGEEDIPAAGYHFKGSMTVEISQPTGNLSGTCRGRVRVSGREEPVERTVPIWGTVSAWKF